MWNFICENGYIFLYVYLGAYKAFNFILTTFITCKLCLVLYVVVLSKYSQTIVTRFLY